MLKKVLAATGLLTFILLFSSCSEYKLTEGGLRYKIIVDADGAETQAGQGLYFNAWFYKVSEDGTDSLFYADTSGTSGVRVNPKAKKGSLEEGFRLLTSGDSAKFLVNVDSFFVGMNSQVPAFLKNAKDLKVVVKVTKVLTAEQVDAERNQAEARQREQMAESIKQQLVVTTQMRADMLASDSIKAQLATQDKEIKSYLAKNKITNAKKTAAGVYYVVQTAGSGKGTVAGEQVSVQYTGRFMSSDVVFDSSTERGPFQFVLGVGQVIHGWDDVVSLLKGGDKVRIYVPAALAYGSNGVKNPNTPTEWMIPPNANLIFDIEVLE